MAKHRLPSAPIGARKANAGVARSSQLAASSRCQQRLRAAVYTRKSSEEGLEQDFNSLHAQREACEAYIASQRHEGWTLVPDQYDDGGYSGGNMDRPALQRLLADIDAGRIDIVVVYKVDRLTRSLADFAKIIETFDRGGNRPSGDPVSFVSVTQSFNTTSSMGRLTLNMLLSFAQFEREVTSERIRDKIAASKAKGMWMGGAVPMGYRPEGRTLVIIEPDASRVQGLFERYLRLGSVTLLADELAAAGERTPFVTSSTGRSYGGRPFSRGHLYAILTNPIYIGEIEHKGTRHAGQHEAIIDDDLWDKVQASLADNTYARHAGTNTKNPSLLVGLLYDEAGNRLTASHATKGDRRYRYYQHPAALQIDRRAKIRMPAGELEALVIDRLAALLTNPAEVASAFATASATPDEMDELVHAAGDRATELRAADAPARRAALLATIHRIEVRADGVTIRLRPEALQGSAGKTDLMPTANSRDPTPRPDSQQTSGETDPFDSRPGYVIDIPARLVLARGQTSMVIDSEPARARPRADKALVKAIARATTWMQQLTTGQHSSISEIACAEQVTDKYVHQLLPLAFLDPDLVVEILDGRFQPEVTVTEIAKGVAIPAVWREQRAALATHLGK